MLKRQLESGADMGPSSKLLNRNTMEQSNCQVPIVIEPSFDDLMSIKMEKNADCVIEDRKLLSEGVAEVKPLSKRQLNLMKVKRKEKFLKDNRHKRIKRKEKLRRMLKRKLEGGDDMGPWSRLLNRNTMEQSNCQVPIVIEPSLDDLISIKMEKDADCVIEDEKLLSEGVAEVNPLSKTQLKLMKPKLTYLECKRQKRLKHKRNAKLRKMLKRKLERGADMGLLNRNTMEQSNCQVPIVIEPSFDDLMSIKMEKDADCVIEDEKLLSEGVAEVKPLSKRQLKLMKRQETFIENKWQRRLQKKAKLMRKKQQKLESGIDLGPSRKLLKRNTMEQSNCRVSVVIDASFDDLMSEKDIKMFCKQIQFCYASNRRAAAPLQFYLTSLGGKTQEQLRNSGCYQNWDIHIRSESYWELFDSSHIVYLTSDSPNVLETLEPDKAYVIGGLVDHNHHRGHCHRLAIESGLNHARLPIEEYCKMNSRSVLTINHVFEILLHFTVTSNWQESLYKVIPQRKLAGTSNARYSHSDDESKPGVSVNAVDAHVTSNDVASNVTALADNRDDCNLVADTSRIEEVIDSSTSSLNAVDAHVTSNDVASYVTALADSRDECNFFADTSRMEEANNTSTSAFNAVDAHVTSSDVASNVTALADSRDDCNLVADNDTNRMKEANDPPTGLLVVEGVSARGDGVDEI